MDIQPEFNLEMQCCNPSDKSYCIMYKARSGSVIHTEEAHREDDFPLVEKDCVRDRLRYLDTHKSMGPNGMHPRVLRELADVIAEPLSIIFERSWRTGEVPGHWRKANVTPIFKKGKKEDPGNYRPVSLTSIPGR